MIIEMTVALLGVTALWAHDLWKARETLLRHERELDERERKFDEKKRVHEGRGVYR